MSEHLIQRSNGEQARNPLPEQADSISESFDRVLAFLEYESELKLKRIELEEKQIENDRQEIEANERIATLAIESKFNDGKAERESRRKLAKMLLNYGLIFLASLLLFFSVLAVTGHSELINQVLTYLALFVGGTGAKALFAGIKQSNAATPPDT